MIELSTRSTRRGSVLVDTAGVHDVAALRHLYFAVYGSSYPLRLGSDPKAMTAALVDADTRWLVARHTSTGEVVGSAMLCREPAARIGKVEGVAVHPDYSGSGIAGAMIAELCEEALAPGGTLDSIYAAARCVNPAPQRALLRHGFRALGLLPGAMKLHSCESLALLIRHGEGILENRARIRDVPGPIVPLLQAAQAAAGIDYSSLRPRPLPQAERPIEAERIEVIRAAAFVERRHRMTGQHPAALLPRCRPNVLFTPPDGRFEVYGVINEEAGCGMLLDAAPSSQALGQSLGAVLQAMAEHGAAYVETLLPLADSLRLEHHLAHGFVPSAVYPAMRFDGTAWHDYVLLTLTVTRPDFRTLDVDSRFAPYLEQYRRSWTTTYLNYPAEETQR